MYLKRAIQQVQNVIEVDFDMIAASADIQVAANAALCRPTVRAYEPIVVACSDGRMRHWPGWKPKCRGCCRPSFACRMNYRQAWGENMWDAWGEFRRRTRFDPPAP